MYYDKGKYESLIMNSPLFGIDKEQETTAYKRESYKMVELQSSSVGSQCLLLPE